LTRDLGIELKDKYLTGPEGGAAMVNRHPHLDRWSSRSPRATPAIVSPALSGDELFRIAETSFYGEGGPPNYREALRLFVGR
jgi:hypothetical protein